MSQFRVRFSANSRSVDPGLHIDAASDPALALTRVHRKSQHGCQECKRRRVKCDETYPVCKRCQRRSTQCTLPPKPSNWKVEKPLFQSQLSALPDACSSSEDKKLLRWWFDSVSNILVLDQHSNPLSLPMMEHLARSPALCCAVQSISAGHKGFFDKDSRIESLVKRSMALNLCREELGTKSIPLTTAFFTVMLLGISTPWLGPMDDYGQEHLMGARAILDEILAQDTSAHDPILEHILTYYTWWDMACSFSVSLQELPPLKTPDFFSAISDEQGPLKPRFGGRAVEMYYLLALLLRYCMAVLRDGPRDYLYEDWLELELLDWHPSGLNDDEELLAEVFQKHGLIIFYRVCRIRSPEIEEYTELDEPRTAQIHRYAVEIVSKILPKQFGRPFLNTLTVPLLTAGAELTIWDSDLRSQVQQAFQSACAECRNNTLFRAKSLLEEVWSVRDSGVEVGYLELIVQKGWNFTFV